MKYMEKALAWQDVKIRNIRLNYFLFYCYAIAYVP